MTEIPKPSSWYNDSWLARYKLTIDTDAAAGGTQTNYPYPITSLPHIVFGLAKSDGSDLVFTSSDGTTKLKRDIASFSRSARTCEIYVEIPSLSSTADTDIYIYFRNPDASEVNDKVDHSITRRIRVTASADDCDIYYDGANWQIESLTRTYIMAGYVSASILKVGSGMRFLNTLISKGATVNRAYITFTAQDSRAGVNCCTRFTGEKVASPATFSTLADYQTRRGTVVGGATDDYITSAQVDWDTATLPAFVTDTEYTSPSLVTILQEIVTAYSQTNTVLFWDDHNDRSTHAANCYRKSYSKDSSATKCALLVCNFTPVTTSFNTFTPDYIGIEDHGW